MAANGFNSTPGILVAAGNFSDSAARGMLDVLPLAIYCVDVDGVLTYFNAAAARLSGRLPQLGIDHWCVTWKVFLPDGMRVPVEQSPMAIVLAGGPAPEDVELIAERPDGTRFWFTPYPAVLRDTEGRITGGINVLVDITARRKAQIEAAEKFHAIVDNTPECVKILTSDGSLVHMNPAGLAMLGAASAGAVLGKNVYDVIAPEHRDRFREFNARVCGGEKALLVFDIVGLHGDRRSVESHAVPLTLMDGTTVHLAFTRDVTERKNSERATLLLSAIVDSSDDAIISKSLDGIITSWNKSAERMFGFTAAESVGRPITMLIPSDRLHEEVAILSALQRGERVFHFETLRQRKDGSLLDISLTISPVKDANGTIIGISKIARDITDRKRIEAAQLASENRFRQLADSLPQIVWTARADGYVDYYNERWYEFTRFTRDRFGDSGWAPLIHPDELQGITETWYSCVHSGIPFQYECRFRDSAGCSWRWFICRALPIRDHLGTIVQWIGSCTDIDSQKRVEAELRRANEGLEQFAFSVAHDLQEPLRSMKLYSELLTKRYGAGNTAQDLECLKFIVSGATRMQQLVHDLLAYAQTSNQEKPTESANAHEALAAALNNLAGSIAETGAKITTGPLPFLTVHPAHLQQLLQNLIGNAIKYRRPGHTAIVHVSAEKQNNGWIFHVRDNGIGIPPEHRERVFGLFKRLHTADQYSGAGIGLAICRKVVGRYQGQIWVDSEPGLGSTFHFTLPS